MTSVSKKDSVNSVILKKKIQEDLKRALKEKDVLKRSVLTMLQSEMHNLEIEKKRALKKEDIIEVITREVKKRKEAIEAYKKGGRNDLTETERKELEILESYLPQKLSEEELIKMIQEAIKETGAESERDFGRVMGALMPKIRGQADGAEVSKLVKKELSKISE